MWTEAFNNELSVLLIFYIYNHKVNKTTEAAKDLAATPEAIGVCIAVDCSV